DPAYAASPFSRSTHGGPCQGEGHTRPPGAAEEGPEALKGPDRGDPRRPAEVRRHGEGVRHADGSAEVRAREGRPLPQPVPHQPVEDRRRVVRPPTRRADWALQPERLTARPSSAGAGPP